MEKILTPSPSDMEKILTPSPSDMEKILTPPPYIRHTEDVDPLPH